MAKGCHLRIKSTTGTMDGAEADDADVDHEAADDEQNALQREV